MDVHAAALNGDVCEVRRYVAGAGDPNLLNEQGITPLHSAAVQGQAEVIRVLVAAGGDTDLKVCRGKEGPSHDASPLLLAVLGGHLEAAQVLLEAGAEVGAKNSKGLTPLHVSCLKPNAAMVRLLLLWGADTNARDRKKRTPERVIGRLGRDPTQEDAIRTAFQQANFKKQTALDNATHVPLPKTDEHPPPPGNAAWAPSTLAAGLQATSKPHPHVEVPGHARDPLPPPPPPPPLPLPLPPHLPLPLPPPPPAAGVAAEDGTQAQYTNALVGSNRNMTKVPIMANDHQQGNPQMYVCPVVADGGVGTAAVPSVPVFSESVPAAVRSEGDAAASSPLALSALPPPPPPQSQSQQHQHQQHQPQQQGQHQHQQPPPPPPQQQQQQQQQATTILSTATPAPPGIREKAPLLPRPPPQPQPQSQSHRTTAILSTPNATPPDVRETAPISITRGTERDPATVAGVEKAPSSAPDLSAGADATSAATACSAREGEAVFSCGAIIAKEYELEKALPCSSGSSEIWFASKVFTGEEVVVKRVSENKVDAFERERAVLKFLQMQGAKGGDQHSIPFLGVLPALRCLVLGRGARNLRQIGQRFYQRCAGNAAGYMDRTRPYARQVVEICQWLHRLGIVWGDVKPENFVEGQDGELKAIDFDSACSVSGGVAAREADIAETVGSRFDADHVLTPRYCAPERAKSSALGEPCLATKASDIWSVGMVLFWLLTGQDYFEEGLTDTEVVETLCSPEFSVSLASVDPKQEQARNLLETMLSRAPARRGSIDGALGRAFFAGGASITAAKMQAEMQSSLGKTSLRLEATLREEAGSTRMLLDESMKRLENRADEILGKIGRMDRMLDAVVEGSADCPRLFILTPATDGPTLWKPDTWFSGSNVLTFLCAHDLAPIGEGIKVPCPRQDLEKWAPAIQASAFVVRLGCKAACMTAGVTPAAVDGMSAALGINLLAGQQVSAALRSAAGKALGDVDDGAEGNASFAGDDNNQPSVKGARPSVKGEGSSVVDTADETEGRKLTGEAYEALVSFLDETVPSWRATLARDMTKAVRGDGKVSWTCHEHAEAWRRSSLMIPAESYSAGGARAAVATPPPPYGAQPLAANSKASVIVFGQEIRAAVEGAETAELTKGRAVTPDAAATVATAALHRDEKESKGGGKGGVGLSMLAKIKGKFARHNAARSDDVDHRQKKEGGEMEHDRAG